MKTLYRRVCSNGMYPLLFERRDNLQKQMDDEYPAMTLAEAYELEMLNIVINMEDGNPDLYQLAIAAANITNISLLTIHR